MNKLISTLSSVTNSTGNNVNESILITDPIKINEVSNLISDPGSDTAICIALNSSLQPLYISSPNKIINCYNEYKKYYNNPQFQSLVESEDTWQSKTTFIVIIECGCDATCNELKSTLIEKINPEYNQKAYLQHNNNCDLINLRFSTKLEKYPNAYYDYIVVSKSFPLWKLKVEIVQFFGNRTFSGPGDYYWVTTSYACHLKTLHIKKGKITHSKNTLTQQYNYFENEQDAINLLTLIKKFLNI